jgi:hypothetical protein
MNNKQEKICIMSLCLEEMRHVVLTDTKLEEFEMRGQARNVGNGPGRVLQG